MLVEFRVKNFRSFRDEQVLSMVASERDKNLPENCVKVGKHTLLKAAAIYGANASGKSNLVKAYRLFTQLIRRQNIMAGLSIAGKTLSRTLWTHLTPFALDGGYRFKPVEFEITFYLEHTLMRYGFSADRQRIHEEWLYAFPKDRCQCWFHRQVEPEGGGREWKISRVLGGGTAELRDKTRDDSLFLPVAAEWNHPKLAAVWEYLNHMSVVVPARTDLHTLTRRMLYENQMDFFSPGPGINLTSFLRKADLGLHDVYLSKDVDRPRQAVLSFGEESNKIRPPDPSSEKIQFLHYGASGDLIPLDIEDESDGTRRFLYLLTFVLGALKAGQTVFLDELDSSLHPKLTREIIRLACSDVPGRLTAQLIFTVHDVTLLDQTLLRRDQIWFTEKQRDGATKLYPLTDYKPRKDESWLRGYLSGRYGAIPITEAFDEDDQQG